MITVVALLACLLVWFMSEDKRTAKKVIIGIVCADVVLEMILGATVIASMQ